MAILAYTTTVAVDKTVAEIQKMLAKGGARQVLAEFDDHGNVTAVAFSVDTPHGLRQFFLPAHPDKVLAVLERDRVPGRYRTIEQAERVAWRILKTWVAAQLALIDTEMVTLAQVMLPYMQTGDGLSVWESFETWSHALESGDR